MKAVAIKAFGDAQVLGLASMPDRVPGPGEIAVAVSASGVNFMDIGIRRGMREVLLPHVLGVEGAGRVVELGEGISNFAVGQRVAWVYVEGSYADRVVGPATSFVPLPDEISDEVAASVMMQGLTASHFATEFYQVRPGDWALVHAAAGGLGQLLTQIIKMSGGKVIGRVSRADKVEAAARAGADHVIVDDGTAFADQALRLTGGEGVDVVFDGSGPATLDGSLAALRRAGTFCWYGPVLGANTTLSIMSLPKSVKIGYAVFFDHIPTPERLRERTARLFTWVRDGKLRLDKPTIYPLAKAAAAHAAMEARSSTGKLLLVP
ncbi:MAG: quinone oxidoreductase [Kaiparowitsia implicata GSE-PSE-MK54-09C]|jgi:NADPH2:quinone reductase|nr:quinone oxidoreductase [Kaiparowitsia implicata GSE-PSE-MK54-09C]